MGVIRFRRLILEAVRALRDGEPPRAVAHPEAYRVRSGGAVAPADMPLDGVMRARFGHEHGLVQPALTRATALASVLNGAPTTREPVMRPQAEAKVIRSAEVEPTALVLSPNTAG